MRAARANPKLTKLGLVCAQIHFNFANALARGELDKGDVSELIRTREALGMAIAAVLGHTSPKPVGRKALNELREDLTTLMHDGILPATPSLAQFKFK